MMLLVDHLKQRHFDLNVHRAFLDEDENVVTFPLYNLSGQLTGFQQYRPGASKKQSNNPREGRYFTYRVSGQLALWGTESLYFTKSNTLFLCEGVFDAARLTWLGYSALAVLSCDVGLEVRDWLFSLNRKVVAVCDNDTAGKKLAKFGHVAVTLESHDLGDATDEEVQELVKNYA